MGVERLHMSKNAVPPGGAVTARANHLQLLTIHCR